MIKSPNQSLNTIHRYVILFLIHAPAKGATLTWIMFLYLKKYFNPRSREGSDLFVAVKVWYPMKISIHAPAKGATCKNSTFARKIKFQSTLPRRERPSPANTSPPPELFQSTLPRRERLFPMSFVLLSQVFQSTLPRRERRSNPEYPLHALMISIHAPAKGATFRRVNGLSKTTISLHAPAKGATSAHPRNVFSWYYFNPRSREGSDYFMSGMFYPTDDFNPRSREGSDLYKQWNERVQQISIHAPAKGATQVGFLKSFYSVSFQSTLPRRERR